MLLRVAAYARVSTGKEAMLHSLAAQTDYNSNLIMDHNGWRFAGIYADEAYSGTKEQRPEFQRMLTDCRKGLIELLISIMSSLAQEESRSISLNVTWGWRKRFADGKPVVPFKRFLGYDRGEHGEMVVNEEEAETVRMIYGEFLAGLSFIAISRKLEGLGIKSPAGNDHWQACTVKSILTNEKYKGCALLHNSTLILIESGYFSFCPKSPVFLGFSAFKADLGCFRDRPFLHFGGFGTLPA